ncbi:hypothetical protein [Pelomonas sp. SE-A7]|uniref:hypothetical protein n=1 Tax=Pelomonas sp. SE-A7 TaxID=3054953 RepID=UPI00259C7C7E|nr:hypothetical protein [Pelomonas sp. SE-A7]MDM4766280.1 hypothetical protein [Pelomonas sp. SE-A7]
MDGGFGIESHAAHQHGALRKAARYLVLIDSGGFALARLFVDSREQVAEFDGSTEETATMISGLVSIGNASGSDWDLALRGHSAQERAAATVYELSV